MDRCYGGLNSHHNVSIARITVVIIEDYIALRELYPRLRLLSIALNLKSVRGFSDK